MEKIIQILAFRLTKIKYKKMFSDDFKIMYYLWQGILGDLSKFVIALILSCLIGSLVECLIIIFIFSSLRFLIGGYHAETFESCFIITILMFLTGVYLVNVLNHYEVHMNQLMFAEITIVVVTMLYPPRFITNINKNKINKYKTCAIVYMLILFTISYFLDMKTRLSIHVAVSLQVFTITPIGYFLLNKINKIVKGDKKHE